MVEVALLSKELCLRLAGSRKTSIVDGIGVNYVIFTQGCSHMPKCIGCHNPSTHGIGTSSQDVSIHKLFHQASNMTLPDGVTFSGGEPLDQYDAVAALAQMFKEWKYRTTLYTGFKIDEAECCYDLSMFDYVIDGRYREDMKDLTYNLKGSKNQRFLKAALNYPGIFTDIHSGTRVQQYIYAAREIWEKDLIWK
jgi:anaerobic ribonucleoside-triphosphate reductase activating protein